MKDKKRDNRARDGDPSRLGRLNRGSFQTPGNPLTRESGASFQISVGQPKWEEKEIKPTDYMSKKKNSQHKGTPDDLICHQQVGPEWRGAGSTA